MYPVKIILPPNKSRILYFKSEEQQEIWNKQLKIAMGYSDMNDFYDVTEFLGKGQFGEVNLAIHKRTGKKVAIKMVKK